MSVLRLASAVLLASTSSVPAQVVVPASDADLILDGEQATRTFGAFIAPAGDVNGDGYDDVLVGDADFDGEEADGGRILLLAGSAGGLSALPAWTLEGGFQGAHTSRGFPAGDVNGDGYDDLLVEESDEGPLRLFTGSVSGPVATSWTSLAGRPAGGGDIDGDGFDDVVVADSAILIFNGSPDGLQAKPAASLPSGDRGVFDGPLLQDANADGHADLIYTQRTCSRDCLLLESDLIVFMGSSRGIRPNPRRRISYASEEVMLYVARVGDVDGDGTDDLAVTVDGDAAGNPDRPEDLFLFQGGPSGVPRHGDLVIHVLPGTLIPRGVEGAGDVNGDGYGDVITSRGYPDFSVHLHEGGPDGLSADPDIILEAEQPGDMFPSSATGAGDVNGDGLDDLIVGAPAFRLGGSPFGRVYVFHGGSSL